jgi:hypothetical protein
VTDNSIAQDKKADEFNTDEAMDEAVELVEESNVFGKLASSIAKPRKGILWGAL